MKTLFIFALACPCLLHSDLNSVKSELHLKYKSCMIEKEEMQKIDKHLYLSGKSQGLLEAIGIIEKLEMSNAAEEERRLDAIRANTID